jgi:hypothetical protein
MRPVAFCLVVTTAVLLVAREPLASPAQSRH